MIHTKFVDHVLDFPKIQKRGAKRGGSAIWAPRNIGSDLEKVENFGFPTLEVWKWKGGQPFRMLVPIKYIIIWSSDESFRGHISIFWHNHYGISDIAICPPFFNFFIFEKSGTSHFTRIKNQSHTTSGSKDTIFWSKKCRILAEIDKRGGKIWFSKCRKIADFCHFGLRLQQLDFSF